MLQAQPSDLAPAGEAEDAVAKRRTQWVTNDEWTREEEPQADARADVDTVYMTSDGTGDCGDISRLYLCPAEPTQGACSSWPEWLTPATLQRALLGNATL